MAAGTTTGSRSETGEYSKTNGWHFSNHEGAIVKSEKEKATQQGYLIVPP